MRRIVIVGCGDIGRRLARRLVERNTPPDSILAFSLGPESQAKNAALGLDARQLDLDVPVSERLLSHRERRDIFYFSPPSSHGDRDVRLPEFLRALGFSTSPRRIVLISTTGVYGDCQGAWIDETAPTPVPTARAKRRLHTEQTLRRWAGSRDVQWVILRVPGIYAADRLPVERARNLAALVRRDQAPWINRIHADDLAEIAVRAMRGKAHNQHVNVCDDQPSTMTDYFQAVRRALNLPPLTERGLETMLPTMSEAMQSYMRESRRIRNTRMKALWGSDCLRYPGLEIGLSALPAPPNG